MNLAVTDLVAGARRGRHVVFDAGTEIPQSLLQNPLVADDMLLRRVRKSTVVMVPPWVWSRYALPSPENGGEKKIGQLIDEGAVDDDRLLCLDTERRPGHEIRQE